MPTTRREGDASRLSDGGRLSKEERRKGGNDEKEEENEEVEEETKQKDPDSHIETLSDLWDHDLHEEELFPRERMAKVLASAFLVASWIFLAKRS